MSSLNAILNTASNAITAYQSAISVTGQNIANADNDDYSIQSVALSTTPTVTSRGNIYGTGVIVSSVASSVNQIIENSLNSELSNQAALEEAKVYMSSIEDLFSEDSDDSLNTLLDAYWSAWEDLSNNPSGETEQSTVYDAGLALTERINAIEEALSDLQTDLNNEISSAVTEVNSIADQIAALNLGVINAESTGGNANDLADKRNALVDDLGERIDIDVTVKEDGSYLIISSGLPLVEDGISYDLSVKQGSVYWTGKSGNTYDITDDISGGAIAGWLEVRDVVIPETQAQFDELATNLIWTLNYQHSQGAGQTYFSGALEGTYEAGESGTFASLYYGDEIDYTKDFSMVIQDATDTTSKFQTVTVDMAISTSEISNLSGEANRIYELTVIDEGTKTVVESSGPLMGSSATGISGALDNAMPEQTLTITKGSDTQTLEISDSGSGATRSAADIAEALSNIDGITASASTTSAYFDLSKILSNDGDLIKFKLNVDGVEATVEFTVDSLEATRAEQFEDALKAAAQSINEKNKNTDLFVDVTSGVAHIESASGATIGICEFTAGGTLSVSPDSSGVPVDINSSNLNDAVVITGSVTITMDPGMKISAKNNDPAIDPDTDLFGAKEPDCDTLDEPAIIYWEILDSNDHSTGESGYVKIDEFGDFDILDSTAAPLFSFNISQGTLIAGNTLRINTDETGAADILQGSVTGNAASVDDTYEFTVTSGGTLPKNKDNIVIQWTSETGSGTIELKDDKDEELRITADVDGMTLTFDGGTLVNGDVFYVTTDENGKAVADAHGNALQTLADWHWTLESFADEFNRSAGGVTASVTKNNTVLFDTHDDYCAIENVTCLGSNNSNIDEENFEITVLNYTALEFEAEGLEFESTAGNWIVKNDPTSTIKIIPVGGHDDGFQIDLDGDDVGDIEITFEQPVSGDGYIRMDLKSRDADDLSYAFAGNEDGDSGVAAALGVNTFFTGTDASTISVNDVVSDGDLMASGILDTETFELASSDNTNALAMAETRYDSLDMKAYTYTRGEGVSVTVTATSLDDYQASLVSTIGSTAAGINSALDYSETLVYQLTAQRDSISAVSLDEEMINLTAQQQAYLAAAKLLTTVQEMFDALLATR
ncbi:flagellar hook-associated protein FlgK [Desulfobacter postgatei]|uniref:Flagellar hook-associated protein 1 n=1 Tax=Desulfobacter postgatei 2ac9 TaxID=879212 RepID=I5B5A8_9BACT|nr:flagellar hook-associated protein FlgK [Desulfobacter postgatei]EIM64671.1 flagellar hook-associated protein FlgK [Desulfobacter postgatei 2ac9]